MTDATEAPKNPADPVPDSTPDKHLNISQDELDRVVTKERKKWEAHYQEDLRKQREQQDLAKLEGEARLKREWEIKERELKEAKEVAERKLAISIVESKLATMGYSEVTDIAPFLIGEDEKATEANVASFGKMVKSLVASEVAKGLASGAPADPSAGSRPDANAALFAEMRKAAGLTR